MGWRTLKEDDLPEGLRRYCSCPHLTARRRRRVRYHVARDDECPDQINRKARPHYSIMYVTDWTFGYRCRKQEAEKTLASLVEIFFQSPTCFRAVETF